MKMLINGSLLDKEDKLDVRNPYDNSIIDAVPRGNIQTLNMHSICLPYKKDYGVFVIP